MRAGLKSLSRRSSWKRHLVIPGDARLRALSAPIRNTSQGDFPTTGVTGEGARSITNQATSFCGDAVVSAAAFTRDWKCLGINLQKTGRYGEARTAFREARRVAPHDTDIVSRLAYLEMECGRYQHAYDLFQIVIRKFPRLELARIHAARSCHELGRKKRARSLISRWPQWQLDNDLSAELGALLIQLGSVHDGLSILEELSDLSQISPRVVVYAVTAFEQAGCMDKARQWAILLPSPTQVRSPAIREEILAWHARLAWRDGDLATARKLLGFLDMPPNPGICRSAKPYWLLAEVCFQQSDYDAVESARTKARTTLKKAVNTASIRGNCHLRRTPRANRDAISKRFALGVLS